jgi:hypothetical protein
MSTLGKAPSVLELSGLGTQRASWSPTLLLPQLPQVPLVRSIVVVTSRSRSTLNRRGQALSEYAMLVAIVGMGLVVIIGLFGQATRRVWLTSESKFSDAGSAATTSPSAAPSPAPSPAPSGSGASGSAQHTPKPSSEPAHRPNKDSSDSSSSGADSPGGSRTGPTGVAP